MTDLDGIIQLVDRIEDFRDFVRQEHSKEELKDALRSVVNLANAIHSRVRTLQKKELKDEK